MGHREVTPGIGLNPISLEPRSDPKVETKGTPPYWQPSFRPPPKLPDISVRENQQDLTGFDSKTSINIDFEENSPFQKNVISEAYERPDKSYFE